MQQFYVNQARGYQVSHICHRAVCTLSF